MLSLDDLLHQMPKRISSQDAESLAGDIREAPSEWVALDQYVSLRIDEEIDVPPSVPMLALVMPSIDTSGSSEDAAAVTLEAIRAGRGDRSSLSVELTGAGGGGAVWISEIALHQLSAGLHEDDTLEVVESSLGAVVDVNRSAGVEPGGIHWGMGRHPMLSALDSLAKKGAMGNADRAWRSIKKAGLGAETMGPDVQAACFAAFVLGRAELDSVPKEFKGWVERQEVSLEAPVHSMNGWSIRDMAESGCSASMGAFISSQRMRAAVAASAPSQDPNNAPRRARARM
ncbi:MULTISPECIES: hypothetical protein [unclassified Thioalkalivibrio]|uniref:hypothetical protein n=1 Tax=unclassified Thioalkalivibrio TaxID=2621013 RepID=UPI0003716E89|nr:MULTISPECIES: hypothetical protein [unclassified Thioalkalivibrio]